MTELEKRLNFILGEGYIKKKYDNTNEIHESLMSSVFKNIDEKKDLDISIVTISDMSPRYSINGDSVYTKGVIIFKTNPFRCGCINYTEGAIVLLRFYSERITNWRTMKIYLYDIYGNLLKHPHANDNGYFCVGGFKNILRKTEKQDFLFYFMSIQYMLTTLNNGSLYSQFETVINHKINALYLSQIDYKMALKIRRITKLDELLHELVLMYLDKYKIKISKATEIIKEIMYSFGKNSLYSTITNTIHRLSINSIHVENNIDIYQVILLNLLVNFGVLIHENTLDIYTSKAFEFYLNKMKTLCDNKNGILEIIEKVIFKHYNNILKQLEKRNISIKNELRKINNTEEYLNSVLKNKQGMNNEITD